MDGKVIGTIEMKTGEGRSSHVGEIGLVVKQGYRDIGIVTAMLETIVRALIPTGLFKNEKYLDDVIMVRKLE